ncbi:unnamed protein product [Trichogramma brassicae]|uniref:Reverse transcriptase domain-containing protein n=1 Tax=Trichogramma brassicae TaxID=86971 RepID=A0A6H5HT30_9HYME|nr:unnamed protein product [Trichogramma brassicae]
MPSKTSFPSPVRLSRNSGKRWYRGHKKYCAVVTIDVRNAFNSARRHQHTLVPSIGYLGMHIDAKLKFDHNLRTVSAKAAGVIGALKRIMPNSGGPRSSRRKLYTHVVDSILLYGAPAWSTAAQKRAYIRQAESAHRRACLRVIGGRPHVSYEATYVLAGIPPAGPFSRTSERGSTAAAERTRKGRGTLIGIAKRGGRKHGTGRRMPDGRTELIPNIKVIVSRV